MNKCMVLVIVGKELEVLKLGEIIIMDRYFIV